MLRVLFGEGLDGEVIDAESECVPVRFVSPKARGVVGGEIVVLVKVLD